MKETRLRSPLPVEHAFAALDRIQGEWQPILRGRWKLVRQLDGKSFELVVSYADPDAHTMHKYRVVIKAAGNGAEIAVQDEPRSRFLPEPLVRVLGALLFGGLAAFFWHVGKPVRAAVFAALVLVALFRPTRTTQAPGDVIQVLAQLLVGQRIP